MSSLLASGPDSVQESKRLKTFAVARCPPCEAASHDAVKTEGSDICTSRYEDSR